MSKNTVKRTLTPNRRKSARRRQVTPVALLVVARFLSGRPLDGRRHSNGTFWTAGTRRVGQPAYLVTWRAWALMSGVQRLVVRLTALAVLLLVLVGVAR